MPYLNFMSIFVCFPWMYADQHDDEICFADPPGYGSGTGALGTMGSILTGGFGKMGILPYIFTIAGLILLFMIIASGYQLLTSTGNPEAIEKGKKRLTAGLTGFILIFAAFWVWQLVAIFFGLGMNFPGG